MDDGQQRAFKVKFEGEGVDDYGGPYRECFSQFAAELQSTNASNTVSQGDDESVPEVNEKSSKGEEQSKADALEEAPKNCMIPLLTPSPNWRNSVGNNREKFIIDPSACHA